MRIMPFFIALAIFSPSAFADLQVIADLGGESAIRFYEAIQPEPDHAAPIYPNAIPATVSEIDMLPVVSHHLTPGYVESIPLNLPGMQPIFLVGADEQSQQWLIQHYNQLIDLSATGLIVNARTPQELTELRQLTPRLTLLPISGDDLAERINLRHYPALITANGVTQ